MIYLDTFSLASENDENNFISFNYRTHMTCYRSYYPFNIFPLKGFCRMDFDMPITILYGGNGSGKTTALNIIAQKIGVARGSLFNDTPFMEPYLNLCKYRAPNGIPEGSRIIVSDDVFDYMLNIRAVNQEVELHRNQLFEVYNQKYYQTSQRGVSSVDFANPMNLDKIQVSELPDRRISKSKFVKKSLAGEVREHSNGETALVYFQAKITENALYLLDEPENSLSPAKQQELAHYIEESAWACGCQFIIATHSPFLLAMERTKIYDLDANPVDIKPWTDLENVKIYRDFFKQHF
ncbi:MAG: AAA family ATPase [Bacteroidales bacterium]|nr:AAA family ATPase [Bacteroidales bacterium]